MKKLVVVLVFVLGAGGAFGTFAQSKNQAKRDDVIKFMKVSGVDKLAEQMMDMMIAQMKGRVVTKTLPDAYWDKFRKSVDTNEMIQLCIPVYEKYYTHDEIKQLIKFYQSPVGQKSVKVAPQIMAEAMMIGQQWGAKIGGQIAAELFDDGHLGK
ncbi:MAG: DUF2059 domain-containing protein [Chitinispirillia bacterium]|nr:DUF2059 domain-containing protein [Chitinispirillia bacterium]MCL2268503.1 DUF2059 domain-containing protein [Chitinispirillia bacterium]